MGQERRGIDMGALIHGDMKTQCSQDGEWVNFQEFLETTKRNRGFLLQINQAQDGYGSIFAFYNFYKDGKNGQRVISDAKYILLRPYYN